MRRHLQGLPVTGAWGHRACIAKQIVNAVSASFAGDGPSSAFVRAEAQGWRQPPPPHTLC